MLQLCTSEGMSKDIQTLGVSLVGCSFFSVELGVGQDHPGATEVAAGV